MIRKGRARQSNLFLLELILAILFFSVSSAVCLRLFVKSHTTSIQTTELNQAVMLATSAAELLTSSEDLHTADLAYYYDTKWTPCQETDASYVMHVQILENQRMLTGSIVVSDYESYPEEEPIYELSVSQYQQRRIADET